MAARSKGNHFLVQGSILAATSLLVRIIGLLYRIPMNNIIGDEGMGIYNNTFEIYNIALILSSYSLPLALSKLVAVRSSNKEYKNSYRIFKSAMVFAIVIGFIATLIIFFGADMFAYLFDSPNIALPLRILAPTIFVFAIMGVLRGFYQGKKTMIPTAVSQVLEQVINAAVSVSAAYFLMKNYSVSVNVASYGAAGGTLGTFTGACVGLIFLLFVFVLYKPLLNKQMRNDTSSNQESYRTVFKLLLITIAPIILSQTVYQISGFLDGVLFMQIMGTKEITTFDMEVLEESFSGQIYTEAYRNTLMGLYGIKYRLLTNVPVAIATAIAASIVTTIATANVRGMYEAIRNKVHAAIKFNMIIAIPSAIGMGVLASPILQLLFHETNQLPANFLRLGCISIVFYALSTVSSAVLQGINRLRIPVINSAISLAIHIVLVIVLLTFTPLSTYALVIGNVTFALVVSILNWISIEKYLNYHQEIIKTFVIPFVSAGLMGVAAYFTHWGLELWTGSNVIATLLAILVAIIVYFAFLIFLKGVDEEELALIPKGAAIVRILKKLHLL
ncbi:MAG: putative polysaccharide biosynthesis protein [Mobilitalea sp.]